MKALHICKHKKCIYRIYSVLFHKSTVKNVYSEMYSFLRKNVQFFAIKKLQCTVYSEKFDGHPDDEDQDIWVYPRSNGKNEAVQ